MAKQDKREEFRNAERRDSFIQGRTLFHVLQPIVLKWGIVLGMGRPAVVTTEETGSIRLDSTPKSKKLETAKEKRVKGDYCLR